MSFSIGGNLRMQLWGYGPLKPKSWEDESANELTLEQPQEIHKVAKTPISLQAEVCDAEESEIGDFLGEKI